MQPVVTAKFIKSAEAKTIEDIGISATVLMENAGRVIAEQIIDATDMADWTATIFCGKGNNGGDGMVVGRILAERGWRVSIIILYKPSLLSSEAAHQLNLLTKLTELDEDLTLTVTCFDEPSKIWELGSTHVVVDAILGTGTSGKELSPIISTAVEWINSSESVVFSVDIPTGLDPDNGLIATACVQADVTVSLGAVKQGLLINDGPLFCGTVEVADIGIPRKLLGESSVFLNSPENVRYGFPVKFETMHKYESGHVVIIAGSKGMHGAAVLSAKAAIKSGAGMVTLLTDQECYIPVASQLSEIMVIPVEYSSQLFDDERLQSVFSKADAFVIGPGLGRDIKTQDMVRYLISESDVPVILDADGLFAFNDNTPLLSKSKSPLILTPHIGEFSRLIQKDYDTITDDLLGTVRLFAEECGHTILLKGRHTLIVNPNGQVMINPTGNPGMATAGSGDVLSGMIGALVAQGVYLDRAASSAAFIHGLAGDIAAEIHTEFGMTANTIIDCISEALLEIIDDQS